MSQKTNEVQSQMPSFKGGVWAGAALVLWRMLDATWYFCKKLVQESFAIVTFCIMQSHAQNIAIIVNWSVFKVFTVYIYHTTVKIHLGKPGTKRTGSDQTPRVLRGVLSEPYCASHIPLVQPIFRRYYFYSLPDQAQIPLDHFNVLDELWCQISFKSDNA